MNPRQIAFWTMIVFIFGLGIYLIYYIHTESYACISNPYAYPIKLLEKASNSEVVCTCSFSKPNSPLVLLTNKGLEAQKQLYISNITISDGRN